MAYPMALYRADPFAMMRRLGEDFDRLDPGAPPTFPAVNVWDGDAAAATTDELPVL